MRDTDANMDWKRWKPCSIVKNAEGVLENLFQKLKDLRACDERVITEYKREISVDG